MTDRTDTQTPELWIATFYPNNRIDDPVRLGYVRNEDVTDAWAYVEKFTRERGYLVVSFPPDDGGWAMISDEDGNTIGRFELTPIEPTPYQSSVANNLCAALAARR